MDSQTYKGPAIQALNISCPALTDLAVRIVVEKFDLDQFIRSPSCGVIEDMHIGFDSLHDDYPEEYSITGKQVLELQDNMSSFLRGLRLDGACTNVFPNMVLPSADGVVPYSASLEKESQRLIFEEFEDRYRIFISLRGTSTESGKCRIFADQSLWQGRSL